MIAKVDDKPSQSVRMAFEMELEKDFSGNYCGDDDQHVLATALPEKITKGKGKMAVAKGCGKAAMVAAKGDGKGAGAPILQLLGVESFVAQANEINHEIEQVSVVYN